MTDLESVFSRSSVKPIFRTKIGTHDVFVADGFVEPDQLPTIQKVFGNAIRSGSIGRDEYPNGCWATIWFAQVSRFARRGGIELSHPNKNEKDRLQFILDAAREDLTRTMH